MVAGAQFGSEAKGHVTHRLIREDVMAGYHVVNVRVGGPNAGHTVYGKDGERFAFRQLPVGAIEEDVVPVIAQGSEIDLPVLMSEIRLREVYLARHNLPVHPVWVDPEATLISDWHKSAESQAQLTKLIGSTGKGIGAARAERLMRKAHRVIDDVEAMGHLREAGCIVERTASYLQGQGHHSTVIIEGTQGYGLGLHAGYYPQCTAGDCTTLDFLAQAGLPPYGHEVEPWIVARMFPIRVAGNSGPLEGETTWEELGLPEERTTVTNKVRRVGHWDDWLFARALAANGGSEVKVAITMFDQMFPETAGITDAIRIPNNAAQWIYDLERRHSTKVDLVTTGPQSAVWI